MSSIMDAIRNDIIMDAIRNDIKEYERLCEKYGIEPHMNQLGIVNPYDGHYRELQQMGRDE